MIRIILKSTFVALVSIAVYLIIAATIFPALAGMVDVNLGLILTIALACSAYTFWQKEKLTRTHEALKAAHAELAAAHRLLAEKARRDDMTGMLNRESFFAVLDSTRQNERRGACSSSMPIISRTSTTATVI